MWLSQKLGCRVQIVAGLSALTRLSLVCSARNISMMPRCQELAQLCSSSLREINVPLTQVLVSLPEAQNRSVACCQLLAGAMAKDKCESTLMLDPYQHTHISNDRAQLRLD